MLSKLKKGGESLCEGMEAVGGVGRTRNRQTFLFGALERDGGKLAVLGAGGLARG